MKILSIILVVFFVIKNDTFSQTLEAELINFERGNGWKEAAKIGFKDVTNGSGENHNFAQIVNSGDGYFTFHTNYGSGVEERIRISNNGYLGVGTAAPGSPIDIANSGDGAELLRLTTERPWVFRQTSSGGATQLDLHSTVSNKSLKITSPNNTIAAQFYVSDQTSNSNVLLVPDGGKVGIGTTDFSGNYQLRVEGTIGAREVKVMASGWPDFVFINGYNLRTLEEVEEHIVKNGRLPDIPSEAEVNENGINVGEMNAKLLQKIEELTLYVIDINKKVDKLEVENRALKEEMTILKKE